MGKLCIKCISCASCLGPISINLIIIIAPFQQLLPKELGALCKCSLAAALGPGEEERDEAKRCHGQSWAGAAVGWGAVLGAPRKCYGKHLKPSIALPGPPVVVEPGGSRCASPTEGERVGHHPLFSPSRAQAEVRRPNQTLRRPLRGTGAAAPVHEGHPDDSQPPWIHQHPEPLRVAGSDSHPR